MAKLSRKSKRINVMDDQGVFMISVAAELADMHPQTLRIYEAKGLIRPKRSPKGTRLYSHADVILLRRIQEMTVELGMNLAGVEKVLELEQQLALMAKRAEGLERQAQEIRAEMEQELERVRRSLRAEIVPYQGGEIVRVRKFRRFI